MTKRTLKLKYYPSQAAFQLGENTVTSYPSGCLRNILFTAFGLRDDIHPLYQKLGEMQENRHHERLLADVDVVEVEKEAPLRKPIHGRERVIYSGRKDFVVTKEDGTEEIHECKGTQSKTTRREVIGKGNLKINHLAQLLSYLIADETHNGVLAVGYYEEEADEMSVSEGGGPQFGETKIICVDERLFHIKIADDGTVLVDGQPSQFTVLDQLKHMQAAADILENPRIAPRPVSENVWNSPCRMCPFSNACDQIDMTAPSLDKAIELAEGSLKNHTPHEPKLFKPKRRRRKNNNDSDA